MRRRLFNIFSALSLLLFVMLALLCGDIALGHKRDWVVGSRQAGAGLSSDNIDGGRLVLWIGNTTPGQTIDSVCDTSLPGGLQFSRRTGPAASWILFVWPWAPLAATALLPATWLVWLLATERHRRSQRGLCRHCRYDLTGNTSGICPECGSPVPAKPAVSGGKA